MKAKRFACPACGGSHFGTDMRTKPVTRICHDEFDRKCNWRGQDDGLCFMDIEVPEWPESADVADDSVEF